MTRVSYMDTLMDKISPEPASGCWLWTAYVNRKGYGMVGVGGRKVKYSHRVMYEEMVGPIPKGMQLDHLCRVPCCVNPTHLEPVTPKENTNRSPRRGSLSGLRGSAKKNKHKTHCIMGHEFNEANTLIQNGHRCCRPCNTEATRVRRALNRNSI